MKELPYAVATVGPVHGEPVFMDVLFDHGPDFSIHGSWLANFDGLLKAVVGLGD